MNTGHYKIWFTIRLGGYIYFRFDQEAEIFQLHLPTLLFGIIKKSRIKRIFSYVSLNNYIPIYSTRVWVLNMIELDMNKFVWIEQIDYERLKEKTGSLML